MAHIFAGLNSMTHTCQICNNGEFKRIVPGQTQQPTVWPPGIGPLATALPAFSLGPLPMQTALYRSGTPSYYFLSPDWLFFLPSPLLFFISVLSNNSVTLSLTLNSCIYSEQSLFTPSYFQSVRRFTRVVHYGFIYAVFR